MRYIMLYVNVNVYVYVYRANKVGKHVTCSRERSIVCTMVDDTKRRKITLENSWVYLKGMLYSMSYDHTISQ